MLVDLTPADLSTPLESLKYSELNVRDWPLVASCPRKGDPERH
jgi:hypothetical protein